jgi:hypothetical protein
LHCHLPLAAVLFGQGVKYFVLPLDLLLE